MLDKILSAVAPGLQARRVVARLNLIRVQAAYDAARVTHRTAGWRADSTSANAEILEADTTTRDRSREMVRNNPYAAAGLDVLVAYQVGTGIVPRPRTGDSSLDRQAGEVWAEWARRADLAGRLDVYGIMAQAARTRAEAGEALVQIVPLRAAEAQARGQRVPLQLQVIEPDLMPIDFQQTLRTGNLVRQGVELDGRNRPVRYWLLDHHPGDSDLFVRKMTTPQPVDARFLLHIYRQDRPGQLRGVPDLAPVMTRLRLLDEYEDSALMQAMAQACVAAFIESDAPEGRGPLEAKAVEGKQVKTMVPGMVERLLPGEKANFLTPSGSGPFSEFTRHQLRAVAAGFGLTYDLLTGDLTGANYSSLRAGRLAFKRRLEQSQWLMLIPRLCQPIWDAFIAQAVAVGALPDRPEGYPCEWGPPRFELLDPLAEAKGIEKEIRLGLKTEAQAISEAGWDPDQWLEETAKWNARKDAVGIVTDSDPRKVAGNGQVQSLPADPAAPG